MVVVCRCLLAVAEARAEIRVGRVPVRFSVQEADHNVISLFLFSNAFNGINPTRFRLRPDGLWQRLG